MFLFVLLLALLAVATAPLLAAGEITEAHETILVPRGQDPESPVQEMTALQADALVAMYAEEHPEITIGRISDADFGSVVNPRSVDIGTLTSVVAPGFVPALFASGALLSAGRSGFFQDVRPLLEKHNAYENIPKALRKSLEIPGGGLMAVPTGGDLVQLFCPVHLLENGVPPTTFAEMIGVMERAKALDAERAVVLLNHYDITSALMLNTYGPIFTQQVIDGIISMTDERLRVWAETVELMHEKQYAGNFGSVGELIGSLQGFGSCVFIGSSIYGTLGFPQPANMVGPFPFPGVEGHLLEEPGFKAALSALSLSFVPALSAQRDIGMDMLEFGVAKRLELAQRGGPFAGAERLAVGAAIPFASLEDLNQFPDDFAVHIAALNRQHAIDTQILPLGVGSPVEVGFDYIDLMDTVLFNKSMPGITADLIMTTLEAIRVEKFLSAALPPVSDVKQGSYKDDIDITLTSTTVGAKIHVTLDGEAPNQASPVAVDGHVTISASGTTTLRAIAVAEDLNPSAEASFVYTIEREQARTGAIIIFVVCLVLAMVIVAMIVIMRRRARISLIDPDDVSVSHVIGIGGRSVVFAGTYRGADVAVKEFVTKERMMEIITAERAKLDLDDLSSMRSKSSVSSSHLTSTVSWKGSMSKMQRTAMTGRGTFSVAQERRQQAHEFKREVRALNRVRHPNIVAFLGAFEKAKRRGIILELMERGSLADVLANPSQILGWKQRVRMALDASRGLTYLHAQSPPILHHDVKSLNMLIDENGGCKVSDFGASVDVGGELTNMGTIAWMAPEVLRKEPYTAASDVYSFGIVLWEIASRAEPANGRTPAVIREETLAGTRPPVDRDSWPEELCDLIEECWAQDPNVRPSLSDVTTRLATMLTELPDDVKNVDTSSISAGSVVVGKEAMKEMQSKLLGGAMPRAQVVEQVSVLFTDIVSFTRLSSLLDPADVADLLNRFFSTLDELAAKHGVLRYQTVGDAYIAVAHASTQPSNLKVGETWTPEKAICDFGVAAVECAGKMPVFSDDRTPPAGFHSLAIRAGIASGPVAFQLVTFDRMEILGDTVNLASRMESTGISRRVQITEVHYAAVQAAFPAAVKHSVDVKGKGKTKTYLLGDMISPEASTATVSFADLATPMEHDDDDEAKITPGPEEASLPTLPGQAE